METQTNRIVTDAAPSYPEDAKKTKKNKRKYWKRKNSKVPPEAQEVHEERETFYGKEEQEASDTGNVTPGTSSDNFESESFEEEEIETQDDQDCESNNEHCNQENKEKSFTEENTKNERFHEQSINAKQLRDVGGSSQKIIEDRHVSKNLGTQKTNAYFTFGSEEVDGQMSCLPQVASSPIQESLKEKFGIETPELFIDEEERAPTPIYNTRFLTKDADTYEVENFEKNTMIIFNHYDVIGYKPRVGTQKDINKLKETFGKYNFKPENIIVHDDYNYKDLIAALKEFSISDFTDYGCVVVVVLTHGKEGGYLMAKDRSYNETELIDHFFNKGNQTLVTKPKVFIVQACRGSKVSQAMLVGAADLVQKDAARERQVYHQPTEADVLLLHSTFAGDASHRETLNGSWFIQSLCTHIVQLAESTDLEAIMTAVKKDVAINKAHEVENRGTGKTDINKQMPVLMSTLTRKLYLKKPKSGIKRYHHIPLDISIIDASNDRCAECNNRRSILPKQHFLHMRNALRLYNAHSAPASTAYPGQTLLNIANSIDEHATAAATMDTIANEISEYLRANAAQWDCYCMLLFL